MSKFKKIFSSFIFLFFFSVAPSFAAGPISTWDGCLKDGDVATLACIPIVLQNIINALVIISSIVCVFLLIYAGIKLVTSEGDPEKVALARKTALYAIGGFILIIGSFLLLNLVAEFTGASRIAPTK